MGGYRPGSSPSIKKCSESGLLLRERHQLQPYAQTAQPGSRATSRWCQRPVGRTGMLAGLSLLYNRNLWVGAVKSVRLYFIFHYGCSCTRNLCSTEMHLFGLQEQRRAEKNV